MIRSLVRSAVLGICACSAAGHAVSIPEPGGRAAPPAPAAADPEVSDAALRGPVGLWFGALEAASGTLRLALRIERGGNGELRATMDSLDQHVSGIQIDKATYQAPTLRLALPAMGATFEGTLDGDRLVGTWTQSRAFPLALSRVDKIEPVTARRPQHPARPFPYREKEVAISVLAAPRDPERAERITLAGTLTLPPGDGPFPAVVLITGSGPQDRDEAMFGHKPFLVLSDALTRRGIATLRVDDRGVGTSTGSADASTTLDLAEDVRAELGWLAAQPEIDRRAIGLVGHSEGGLIAPIVAAASDRARFIVMLAGTGMSGAQLLRAQLSLIARAAGASEDKIARDRADTDRLFAQLALGKTDAETDAALRAFVDADPAHRAERESLASRVQAQRAWMRTFLALDPVPYLGQVRVPVLAIAGELDLQVPRDNLPLIEAALRRGNCPDITTRLMPGLNHLFQHATTGAPSEYSNIEETFAPEAIQLIGDWLVERTSRLRR
jgi:uncharacterized protein